MRPTPLGRPLTRVLSLTLFARLALVRVRPVMYSMNAVDGKGGLLNAPVSLENDGNDTVKALE